MCLRTVLWVETRSHDDEVDKSRATIVCTMDSEEEVVMLMGDSMLDVLCEAILQIM